MYKTDTDLSDDTLRQKYLQMFPGVLNQQDDSTNARILNIVADLLIKYKNSLLDISDQVLINNASGQTLTDIANDWGVNRIDDDDEFLRFQLRLQKMRGMLGVTTNDLKQIVATALNIDITSFDVVGDENPEEIELTDVMVDFKSGNKQRMKYDVLIQSIQDVLAPEYKLKDMSYAVTGSGAFYIATHATVTPEVNVKEDPNTYRNVVETRDYATQRLIIPEYTVKEAD